MRVAAAKRIAVAALKRLMCSLSPIGFSRGLFPDNLKLSGKPEARFSCN